MMDSAEPSGLLYTRLTALDPESASKIMGFVLIHGPNESDMMSLATSPDSVLQQLISKGKNYSKLLTTSSLNLSEVVKGEDFSGSCEGSPRGFHKRSFSVNDAAFGGGLDEFSSPGAVGWRTGNFDGFEQDVLRARATQQQRLALASQIMSASALPYNKFLSDSPRSKAAALMMGEEAYKLAQFRNERSDLAMMGSIAGSRQIYLTFPADSTFKEEDVSNYFSIYGPVQDVRIPYQQKRMFGFVTFVHPETVKIILAKGNPHFVCDSRVLVKPYKEKGKVEKKHLMTQQLLERGDLSSCSSPHGVNIRDFDVPIGPRMFYNNTQDFMMRRKLEEQAEFQQALEMQSRKLADLKLLELKNLPERHPFSSNHNLSPAAAMSSPTHHPFSSNHNISPAAALSSPTRHPLLSPNRMRSTSSFGHEAFEENDITPTLSLPPHVLGNRHNSLEQYSNANNSIGYFTSNPNKIHQLADSAENESIELVLPDTLDDTITSRPAAPSSQSIFLSGMLAMNGNDTATNSQFSSNSNTMVSSACISNMTLPKSLFLDDPSFGPAGNRVIEM